MWFIASTNAIQFLLIVTEQLHHPQTHEEPRLLLKNLLCCGASFAVVHVDILHGDEGDAVFLSIGCGAAFRYP